MSNVSNSAGRTIVVNMNTPTTLPGGGAVWAGMPAQNINLPMVAGHLCQGKGQGLFLPNSDGVQRINPKRGTIDVWAVAPTAGAASHVCLVGNSGTTFLTPNFGYIRVGVSAANRLTGTIQNEVGTTIATFTDATVGALVAGQLYRIQFGWDATEGTVGASLNGTALPASAFSVSPSAAWTPPTLDRFNLYKGVGQSRWNADIVLVQFSSQKLV